MNKNKKVKMIVTFCLSCALGSLHAQDAEKAFIKENMTFAADQYRLMLKTPAQGKDGKGVMPHSMRKDGTVSKGSIEPVKTFTDNHDIGFMMYCSYGNANRFEPKPEYKDILVESARSLCTRFRPKAGVIQSWNGFRSWHGDKVYDFPVIIDNMMNLELLFYASRVTGDDSFRKVAIR